MSSKNDIGVALTKCFYCGNDSDILMNRVLTKHMADKVKECHGKVVSMEPCQQCKTYMDIGIIVLTYDPEKSPQGQSPILYVSIQAHHEKMCLRKNRHPGKSLATPPAH